MHVIFIDADACPVKPETYRVADRYKLRVAVVANCALHVPSRPLVELIVREGFGAADDYIAEACGPGDVVITVDIPLAARALDKGARVLGHKGHPFTEDDIGSALATRELMETLRQTGERTGGPAPMNDRDRSRFLAKLDELANAVLRGHPRA